MAKQSTKCDVCGGSTDGTPSGIKKHNATSKHTLAAATAAKVNKGTQRGVDGFAEAIAINEAAKQVSETEMKDAENAIAETREGKLAVIKNGDALTEEVYAMIREKEQELQRRSVDLNWRVAHQPSKAEAYALERVYPVERELNLLRSVYNRLMEA